MVSPVSGVLAASHVLAQPVVTGWEMSVLEMAIVGLHVYHSMSTSGPLLRSSQAPISMQGFAEKVVCCSALGRKCPGPNTEPALDTRVMMGGGASPKGVWLGRRGETLLKLSQSTRFNLRWLRDLASCGYLQHVPKCFIVPTYPHLLQRRPGAGVAQTRLATKAASSNGAGALQKESPISEQDAGPPLKQYQDVPALNGRPVLQAPTKRSLDEADAATEKPHLDLPMMNGIPVLALPAKPADAPQSSANGTIPVRLC